MAKFMRKFRVKSLLLLVSSIVVATMTLQMFRQLSFIQVEIQKNGGSLIFHDDIHIKQSSSPGIHITEADLGCSRVIRLGLPNYISDACKPEDHQRCLNLTCENILSGSDKSLYAMARELMSNKTRRKTEPEDFIQMTENCDEFLSKRGFEAKMKAHDEYFPIAFNILAHGNIEQVERLIHSLYRPWNRFCVHFDLKSIALSQEALLAINRCLPNVFSASKRFEVFWGGFSRLEADIQCMKDHVDSGSDWKYLINTAGQAFPLRSITEIVEILKIYNGANDLEGMHGERVIRHRFEYKFEINKEGIIVMKEPNVKHPDPPHDLDIIRGSAYGTFSREFVEFILNDRRSQDFLEWSKETFSPDELYFSTLHHTYSNPHLHSPGGYSGNPDEKPWLAVFANWGSIPCSGYERHGICVFGVEDLPRLVNRKELFANKFLTGFEPMALDCMRAWIDYKDSCVGLSLLDREFYRNLSFIKKSLS